MHQKGLSEFQPFIPEEQKLLELLAALIPIGSRLRHMKVGGTVTFAMPTSRPIDNRPLFLAAWS